MLAEWDPKVVALNPSHAPKYFSIQKMCVNAFTMLKR